MSEIVLTYQNSPGAAGANLAALHFTTTANLAFTTNDGVQHQVPATNNSGNTEIPGKISLDFTSTANVGSVTINKPSGRAIVPASATTLVVTNNFVTANSLVFALAAANDSTGFVKATVAAAGNFTVHCNAPTLNMPVNFVVFNG